MKRTQLSRKIFAFALTLSMIVNFIPTGSAADKQSASPAPIPQYSNAAAQVYASQEAGCQVNVEGYAEFARYSDVSSKHWARNAISYVTVNCYMTGTDTASFSPGLNLTSAQIILILYKLAGGYQKYSASPYSDVKSNDWFYQAVNWGYGNSLTQIIQKSKKKFGATRTVSRAQIAQLVWKLACQQGWAKTKYPNVTLPYTDIGTLTGEQKSALKWCYYSEIMKGTDTQSFSPDKTVSRAEMAQICYKLDKFIASETAFIVGTDYRCSAPGYNNSERVDTSMIPEHLAPYYEAMGYRTFANTMPTRYDMGSQKIKSQIVFLAGHGSNRHMQFHWKQTRSKGDIYKTGVGSVLTPPEYDVDGYYLVGLCANMDFVDLIVFMGCKTAFIGDDPSQQSTVWNVCIPEAACRFGAKVAVGWTDMLYYNEARDEFAKNLTLELASGRTIKEALHAATYNYNYTYKFERSNLNQWAVYYSDENKYKNSGIKLKKSAASSAAADAGSANAEAQNLLASYQGSTQIPGDDLVAETAAVLRALDESFEFSDYQAIVHEHNDGTAGVVFYRIVGGFVTDYQYRIRIDDNHLVSILDTTKELTEDIEAKILEASERLEILPQAAPENAVKAGTQASCISEAMRLAREEIEASVQKPVDAQRYEYYYDIAADRPCILVFTDYSGDTPEMIGGEMFVYDLEKQEGATCNSEKH